LKSSLKLLAIFILFFTFRLSPQISSEYSNHDTALSDTAGTAGAIQFFSTEPADGIVDPSEYILGAGDKIFISISGIEDINLYLVVNQEGIIFIPKVGSVDLNNTTLESGKRKIEEAINRYYKNVGIFVSLAGFKKIKVSLLGHVNRPYTYSVSSNSRLNDLLFNSAGLKTTSDHRNIKVVNNQSDTSYYDFRSFLRFGGKENNPLLREGDIILVDKTDRTISINGNVKFPGTYEYVEGESISSLIALAGGFLNRAKTDTIELVRYFSDGSEQRSIYLTKENYSNEYLAPYDKVLIRGLEEYYVDRFVLVEGYVKYPGYYKISENKTTLLDIITEAGGFRKDASLTEASLTRSMGTVEYDPEFERLKNIPRVDMTDDEYDYLKAKSRHRQGKVVVDFDRLFNQNNLTENVILKRNDVIEIPEAKNYVILLGQVVYPGNVIYNPQYTVEDYIDLAGGFAWRALENDVRVIKANTGEWVDADEVEALEPGDTIWVPEDPPGPKFWDVFTTSLAIVGQVAAIVAATMAVIVASR
jgi:polysaccharide biosynthesis/export protein